MKTQKFIVLTTLIFLFSLTSLTSARVQPTYAIINCKIFPVSGPPIEKGAIVIRDGLIEALGPMEKVSVPEDAEVVEAEGLCAYPGLIDAHTSFFLEVRRPQTPTPGAAAAQPAVKQHPEFEALEKIKPKKTTMDSLHKIGITTILVVPETGIYAGQSVLLNLNGDKVEPMIVVHPFALHVNFTSVRGGYPSSVMGTMAYLRQSFFDTQHYAQHKSLFSGSAKGLKRPEYDPFLETLVPYVIEKKPLVFNCTNQEDIKRAIRLIKEFKLNGYLTGANEAWRVGGLVKQANVPLLVSLDFKPPYTSSYANQGDDLKEKAEKEIYPSNAANLHKQGVTFALTSNSIKKTADIMKNIQKAIEKGLPKEEALKAMTLTPARYLGVDNILGSLEEGKIANIVLTSEEIFTEKAQIRRVFVDGLSFEIKQTPKKAKQTTLNLSGRWDATLTSMMGKMEFTMEIEQDGNQISGKMVSDFGEWTISDGILSGKEITFTITGEAMGRTVDLVFSGQAEEDTIEGATTIMGSPAELRAKRIPGASD